MITFVFRSSVVSSRREEFIFTMHFSFEGSLMIIFAWSRTEVSKLDFTGRGNFLTTHFHYIFDKFLNFSLFNGKRAKPSSHSKSDETLTLH